MDVSALVVVGLVMVLSASSVQALRDFGSSWVVFQRQAMWVLIGAVALTWHPRLESVRVLGH